MKVGLSGGIGAGKTTVARLIQSMGYPVYNADDRARKLQNEDAELLAEMVELLGTEIITDGRLNRKTVADRVFNQPELLRKLNAIVHPRVQNDFDQWVEQQKSPVLFKESALLIETGSYKALDALVVVTAPEEVRVQRVLARDSTSRAHVKSRMANQTAEEEKVKLADFVVNNDDHCLLIPQVEKLIEQLIDRTHV